MVRSIARRLLGALVGLLDLLHLRWIPQAILRVLPPRVRIRLSRVQMRLGFLEGMVQVPPDQLEDRYRRAVAGTTARPLTYLEFGVYIGTSMICMHRGAAAAGATVRLVGFDSFQGLPASAGTEDDATWQQGQYYSDVELTRTNLRRNGVADSDVELVPGWYDDSLTAATRERLGLARADIVMIDCDLASSTRSALDFCTPLVVDETIFFFDDWAINDLADRGLGERKAFEEWLADHSEFDSVELPDLSYADKARAFRVSRHDHGAVAAADAASAGSGTAPA